MATLTFSDVQTRVMNQLRMPVTNTTEAAKVAAVINEVYRDIAAKQDWFWLLKRGVINCTPRILDTTVALTLGSTSGTFSATPQQNGVDVSVAGFVLSPDGSSEDTDALYRVATHTSGLTAFTLDAGYTNTTTLAGSVRLYQDSYVLPTDTGKVINVKRFGRSLPLRRAGLEEMSWRKLTDRSEGPPEVYSVFDHSTTGDPTTQRMLQIHPFPDDDYHRLEVFYKQTLNTEVSGAVRFLIPDDYSQVLIYGTLSRAYPIFMNDIDRGRYYQQLFNDMMALMSAQQKEYASDHSGIAPDMGYRPHKGRNRGRVSMGRYFDTWPNVP
jgi:hypothetical protein